MRLRNIGNAIWSRFFPKSSLLPEIAAFLDSHREFGNLTRSQPVRNWINGERQRVAFDTGRSLHFYAKDGAVSTVYEYDESGKRNRIWGGDSRDDVSHGRQPATR
jgi:hypothetical protein